MSQDDLCNDDEVRDFLVNDCQLSKEDIEKYLQQEQIIRQIGSTQTDIFLSDSDLDQLFRVMRNIVHGHVENPYDAYERAMGIL